MKYSLATTVKERVWKLKSIENKTFKEIQNIMGDEGVNLTVNQINEVSREMRVGNRYGRNENQIATIKTNTMDKREAILTELENMKNSLNDPEAIRDKLEVIKQMVGLLDGIDRYSGKGTPHTQINILQIKARDEKFDKFFDWVLIHSGLTKEKIDEFEHFMGETEKIIDAKYTEENP